MRRQVTVSWDSGGSDEAPPKVRRYYTTHVCASVCLLVYVCMSPTGEVIKRICHACFVCCEKPCHFNSHALLYALMLS